MGEVLALDRQSRMVTVQAGIRAVALEQALGERLDAWATSAVL